MEEIVTILSTREWAIAIWGTGFFVWMLTQREIRKSLWNVIKILLGKKLRHFFLIIALYVAGITMIFYQLPFWNNIYLKDIILWLIFSGISYCVNSIIKGDAEHLSENGKLWQEPLYDRNAILKRFIDAKKIYDLNNDIYMELALTKSSWSVIGYVSHKEYSGDFLLNWYNALVDLDEANIHRFAREIKDVSDKIELLGDNRMRHHIDSKIFSDVFSEGIKDIISFLKNEYYFSQAMKSPYYLVDGLTGYLRKNNPNREQLLLIWTTGMVLLDWRLEDNHSSIAALQKAIEICALRNGYCDIHSDLSLLGPAYINLMGDPVKYIIPDRWVDNTSFSEETTSVEYYEQMIHEYVQDKSYSSTAILQKSLGLFRTKAMAWYDRNAG